MTAYSRDSPKKIVTAKTVNHDQWNVSNWQNVNHDQWNVSNWQTVNHDQWNVSNWQTVNHDQWNVSNWQTESWSMKWFNLANMSKWFYNIWE